MQKQFLDRNKDREILEWAFNHLDIKGVGCECVLHSDNPWARVYKISDRTLPNFQDKLYFLKIPIESFAVEASLQKMLSAQGFLVVRPIAILRNQAYLMHDHGIQLRQGFLNGEQEKDPFTRIAIEYAWIQCWYSKQLEHSPSFLSQHSLPDYSLQKWPERFSQLIHSIESNNYPWNVDKETIIDLHGSKSLLEDMCGELLSLKIPLSISHGDFHDGNIFIKNNVFHIVDWGESSLCHPFLSFLNFCEKRNHQWFSKFEPTTKIALENYTNVWKQTFTSEQIEKSLIIARILFPIFWAFNFEKLCKACNVDSTHCRSINSFKGFGRWSLEQWI